MKSRGLAFVALAVAGLALGVGLLIRSVPSSAPTAAEAPAAAASAAHPLSNAQLERTVAQMREQVKVSPNDAAAWAMLAHSYDMLGRYTDASTAYARLVELVPGDAQVLADAADSLAAARGRQLNGEPMQMVQRALALDPKNLKALSLAGTEAFDRRDPAQAIAYWQRARAQVTDAGLAQEIDANIAAARSMAAGAIAGAAPQVQVQAQAQASAASGAGFVTGRIVLADKLKERLSPSDTLFVFARPAEGSRMPVALMRRRAQELPIEFRLDDSMALVPQARLSAQSSVIVGARISRRGDATPHAGDLQGLSAPVAVGTQGLRVEITEVVQ
jgi:cytochrome c-type biogenesis protein CcmH